MPHPRPSVIHSMMEMLALSNMPITPRSPSPSLASLDMQSVICMDIVYLDVELPSAAEYPDAHWMPATGGDQTQRLETRLQLS